jgi:hypothetical protein
MNTATTGILPGSTTAKIVAGAIFLFIALIVIFAVNTRYHFLPVKWDLFKQLGLVKSEDATYWTDPNALTTLAITQTQLPANFPTRFGYSIMFDTMIFNSRASFTVSGRTLPYRHLLHRGSNDLGNAGTPAGCGGGGSGGSSAITSGLPQYMNPGFIGDPSTNDIIVFIDTSAGRESARISNLSLATPYRIGLVVYEGFFEIYEGCKLLLSQVFKGTPIAINPSGIYALAGSFALSAKLQNLRIWSTTLPVQQIVTECSGSIRSFGSAPPCTAISVNPALPASTTGTGTDAAAAATIASVTGAQCPSTS